MTQEIPAHATCRSFGCYKKATEVIYDTKGRKQYCCDLHKGNNKKEKPVGLPKGNNKNDISRTTKGA